MKNRYSISAAVFFFVSLFILVQDAQATFNLSVSPRRGTRDIRFEKSAAGSSARNEEVTFTVTSDQNRQYQIIQQVFQQPTNEFGNTIPMGAIVVFSPSSPIGKLRTQLETPLIMGQQQIYTSDSSGTADEFVLVFNLTIPEDQPGGVYRTQVSFILEPVDVSAGLRSVENLDIIIDIRSSLKVDVQNAKTGGRGLDFRLSKDKKSDDGTLNVRITNNVGQLKLIQQSDAFVSKEGEVLDEEVLKYSVVTDGNGSSVSVPEVVAQSPKVIYVGDLSNSQTNLQLQYSFSPDTLLKAGTYLGNIVLRTELPAGSSGQPQTFVIPVKIEVEAVFYLDVKTEEGVGGFNFGIARTGFEQRRQKVTLQVFSNLEEPYQISQILPRGLVNAQGTALPGDSLFYATLPATTGEVTALASAPVKEGESKVFTSDKKGTPETVVLEYSLQIPKGAKAGSYSSGVKYSITTL